MDDLIENESEMKSKMSKETTNQGIKLKDNVPEICSHYGKNSEFAIKLLVGNYMPGF